jgi:hypothetical protein
MHVALIGVVLKYRYQKEVERMELQNSLIIMVLWAGLIVSQHTYLPES